MQVVESKIYPAMVQIMADVDAIAKGRRNQAQGYQFRGIDDVYMELHPVLAKHGVFMTSEIKDERSEERTTKNGGASIYRIMKIKYTFWAQDGSYVCSEVIGEGMDSGDKASNKAMSVAQKYALLQAFLIPTEDAKDPENESHTVEPKKAVEPAKAAQPASNAKKSEATADKDFRGQIIEYIAEIKDLLSPEELKEIKEDLAMAQTNRVQLDAIRDKARAKAAARSKPKSVEVEMPDGSTTVVA